MIFWGFDWLVYLLVFFCLWWGFWPFYIGTYFDRLVRMNEPFDKVPWFISTYRYWMEP